MKRIRREEVDHCTVTSSIRSCVRIPEPILSAKHWVLHNLVQGGNNAGFVCIWVRRIPVTRTLSHKCQCLAMAWVSRVLTPSIPGEHMDAIMQRERAGERKKGSKSLREAETERESKRRAINWHLACVFGSKKISLIPCSSFPLWICQWRVLVKSGCDGFLTHSC